MWFTWITFEYLSWFRLKASSGFSHKPVNKSQSNLNWRERAALFWFLPFALLCAVTTLAFQPFLPGMDFSKQCMSEVCSQHASCAYMWIILAREQCSSTWPASWNIPLCDPSEASHPTVTPLSSPLHPCSDPEECPRGPTDQPCCSCQLHLSGFWFP